MLDLSNQEILPIYLFDQMSFKTTTSQQETTVKKSVRLVFHKQRDSVQ